MKHPVVSVWVYLRMFAVLVALSGLQVFLSFRNLGAFNGYLAVAIACAQFYIVVAYFMHLKWSARILWLYAGAGLVFFALMIALLLGDYRTRSWQPTPKAWEPGTEGLPVERAK